MALPTIALADHLVALLSDKWSVVQGPVSQLQTPTLVLRADEPWSTPSAYCHDEQRYAAVAVVSASTPADGESDLFDVIQEVQDNLPEGWGFISASRPVVDQSTDSPLLAAIIRLRYYYNPPEES
jgi:hypothetical protein